MMVKIFIFLIALVLAIAYLRYFEQKSIYFPMKEIGTTPRDVGLEYEDVYFKTKDDVELNGWLVSKEGSSIYLLFCHGNAGNISHRLEIINMFVNVGLNVFIFDYRGYGKSQGKPSEKGLYKDAAAAYGYLISRGVKKEKIVIFGESLGGAVAIELAKDLDKGALITEGAFTSVPDMAGDIYPFLPIRFLVSSRYNSISKIKDVKIAKLIIHSRDDEIILYKHGKRLFEVAPSPKEFLELRGSHNEAVLLMRKEFSGAVSNFVKRYISE